MGANKGKPSGNVAGNKRDPGIKSNPRGKSPSPGAGGARQQETEFHPAGSGHPEHNAGGPQHHGADADEDYNP